ncbi:unnamed protein product, partial [Prunus brigantina]
MKGLDDRQSKVEKFRKVQLKDKPPVLKSQVATKVSGINPRRDKTSQRCQPNSMDEDVFDEVESMIRQAKGVDVEGDKVMVDAQTPEAKEKAEQYGRFEAMVVTFLLFFEAQPGQPNSMDEDVFNEVESMVHMGEPKEIKVTREFPKAEVA